MACLLYSWFLCYLRVSDCLYAGGNVGAVAVLTSDGWATVLASPAFTWVGIAAILSTQVLTSSSLFPIPLLLGDADCRRVWNIGNFSGNSSVAVAWYLLAIATIAFVEVLRVYIPTWKLQVGQWAFRHSQPFQTPIQYLWIAIPYLY